MSGEKINYTEEENRLEFKNEEISIDQLSKGGLGVFVAALNPGTELVVNGVHSVFKYDDTEDSYKVEQHSDNLDLSTKIVTDDIENFRCPKGFVVENGRLEGIIHPSESELKTKLVIPFFHKNGAPYQAEEFSTAKEGDIAIGQLNKDEMGVFLAVSNPGTDIVVHGLHNTLEWDEKSDRLQYKQQRLNQLDTSNRIITDEIEGFKCPDGFMIVDGHLKGITQPTNNDLKSNVDIPFFRPDGTQY